MAKEEKPDQARSWAIALAACVINTMLSGISRTTGLFYVAIIETYGVTRFQANLPFTMRKRPLVGAIGQRYGPRDVTIVGGLCASLGILLCYFASDVTWIIIFWGGMHGLGVALGNTLFQVVITQYFVKYRATATGLAISGACVGSFVFPIFIEYALKYTGLSGAFLLTGGLMMHVLPAGIMMKEPPWIHRPVKPPPSDAASSKNSSYRSTKPSKIISNQNMGIIQEESDVGSRETRRPLSEVPSATGAVTKQRFDSQLRVNSGIDNPAYTGSKLDIPEMNYRGSKHSSLSKMDSSDSQRTAGSKTDLSAKGTEQVSDAELQRPRFRTISFGEVSVTIPIEPTEEPQETSLYRGIIKVCRDPMFHLISVSLAAFAMVFDPAITVIVDYLMDKGLKEDVAKYFISMLALGDLIGRLCLGWVTDKNYLSIPKFMMILQLIQGICFLLTPLFYTFDVLMTLMVIYGLASGATLVMFPILVNKYLQSVQSLAMGSIQFFSGILSFAVPPIIGYFRDQVGSYDGMFYITGGMSVIAGFLWLLEPLLVKLKAKLEKDQSDAAASLPS